MKNMRMDHRRFDIAMPQQLPDSSNIRAAFEQMRGNGMPERVAGSPLGEPSHRPSHCPLGTRTHATHSHPIHGCHQVLPVGCHQ